MEYKHLIAGCKKNERKSQEALYRRFFAPMMSMCMRYISDRNQAAAIVNDGFVKVFTKIDSYQNKGSFEGWIRRIVFHCLSDAIRKDSNYMKFMVFEDYENQTSDNVLANLYEEDILKLIDKIPAASGDVFILYAVKGYAHKEIAEMKNISIGTSKWHLSEARKKLQALILNIDSSLNAG